MSEIIQDGTGTSNKAKVDSRNRISTLATTQSLLSSSVKNGDGYAITSGLLTLTSDSQSAILHFKNNEIYDFVLTRAICTPFRTTDGTEDFVLLQSRFGQDGLSGGTGNEATFINVNLGSAKTLNFESEKGQEGASMSGTNSVGFTFAAPIGRTYLADIFLRVPPGQTFGLLITPPPGNTSLLCVGAVNGYLDIES